MKSFQRRGGLGIISAMVAVAACQGPDQDVSESTVRGSSDIQAHLDALPRALVVDVDRSGVPKFVTGELGRVQVAPDVDTADLLSSLAAIAPVFRANAEDLVLRRSHTDPIGDQHLRFAQRKNGLTVIGGELVVHVRNGVIYGVNGRARGDLPAPVDAQIDVTDALARALEHVMLANAVTGEDAPLAYYLTEDRLELVYQVDVTGVDDADASPVHDTVLVNANDGSIALQISHIHAAKNREIYDLNKSVGPFPGAPKRSEGDPKIGDNIVDTNYSRVGATYNCYENLFGRDSFDNAGGTIISSVNHGASTVDAKWTGTQMWFGSGDGVTASNLAIAMDIVAHEFTHAVTQYESGLIYSNAAESGALNEAMSDIFGSVCEWFHDNEVISADTWKLGKEV